MPKTYRIVHARDVVPQLPPIAYEGFTHFANEVWYPHNMGANDKRVVCDSGESLKCSDGAIANLNVQDHLVYFEHEWVDVCAVALAPVDCAGACAANATPVKSANLTGASLAAQNARCNLRKPLAQKSRRKGRGAHVCHVLASRSGATAVAPDRRRLCGHLARVCAKDERRNKLCGSGVCIASTELEMSSAVAAASARSLHGW